MKKIIGSSADVHLKDGEVISGLIFEMDEEYVYVQQDVGIMIAIPKQNIKYYVCKAVDVDGSAGVIASARGIKSTTGSAVLSGGGANYLMVFVDGEAIADVPVLSSLDQYSPALMEAALLNSEVQESLYGKRQTSAEYYPGKLYIETDHASSKFSGQGENTFSMGGIASERFVDPSEMVTRLDGVIKNKKREG